MVEHTKGNLLEAAAEALVNTVNCVGVMGKGIALQFKQAYPENFKHYQQVCKAGALRPGIVLVHDRGGLDLKPGEPRYIINFPTKQHWRGKSRLAFIEEGLIDLIKEVQERHIQSIAIPPLGCGNGGLDWNAVRPMIEAAFAQVPDVRAVLYEPGHAPLAEALPVRTAKPRMTRARALYLRLLDLYGVQDYTLGQLEVQKLAYFLQVLGEPLKLRYEKGQYGPYADNLNHALQALEGHYIRGYGDRADVRAAIHPMPGAVDEARSFLSKQEDAEALEARLRLIEALIEGFETPYGMELLATVHWLFREFPETRHHWETTLDAVQDWNIRKQKVLYPEHIKTAWTHLHEQGWVPVPTHVFLPA